MNKLLLVVIFLVPSFLCAQTKLGGVDSSVVFASTEVGRACGDPSEKQIGKEGGSLVSGDGKIELVFPDGALTSKTNISIQPSINTARDGVGFGYSLEPSGIQFKKPVQLIFHYTARDMSGGSPQLMGIASQDEKGVWYGLQNLKLDTVTHVVSGFISHFSTWALSWSYHLSPERTRVKVKGRVKLFLYATPIGKVSATEHTEVVRSIYGDNLENPRSWSVNGKKNGNSEYGTIDDAYWPALDRYVTYKAPDQVPSPNPVDITLEIEGAGTGLGDGLTRTLTRNCRIMVYDNAYEVRMVSKMKGSSMNAWAGNTTYYDEGSFVVTMEDGPKIEDIENKNEELRYYNCNITLLNPESNTGLIDIKGSRMIRVNPAQPPQKPYAQVEIEFIPHPAVTSSFRYNCPPPPGSHIKKNATGITPSMPMFIPSYPVVLRFSTKDGEQVLQQIGTETSDLYLKITVKRLTD
jgi:hypothetical protein